MNIDVQTILLELAKILTIATPVTMGVVQVAKMSKMPSFLAPVASLVIGVLTTALLMNGFSWIQVLFGVIAGLSASGLYSGVSSTSTTVSAKYQAYKFAKNTPVAPVNSEQVVNTEVNTQG